MRTSRASRARSANACWGRSHELLRHQSRLSKRLDEVSRLVSAKLAAFLKTLRDSGFAVGLAEGQDAAELMAAGYAAKPGLLRSAFKHLFSARKSDWEKFDGIFDAFWLGKRVRSRSMTTGSSKAANNPSLKSLPD